MSGLPEPLEALAAALEAEGLDRRERPPDPESFGDQVVTLHGDDLAVRLVRDRGEWTIELAHPSWDEWFDPDVWRAQIEGTDPMEPSAVGEQAAWVRDELGAVRRAAAEPATLDRLDEIATARAELWFR